MTTNTDEQNNISDDESKNTTSSATVDSEIVEKIVKERLEESLKDIKSKLDKAYGTRDETLKKLAEYEQKEKEAELKRLQDEGKHKEAYELQLAEEKAKREALEKRNIELTRDLEVRTELSKYTFRSDKAIEMARKEVVDQLVQDDKGLWVHKSGISISDFVKVFSENDDNSFLFKAKTSSGSGSSESSTSTSSTPKSLFEMSQEEVLKLAQEGKLRKS